MSVPAPLNAAVLAAADSFWLTVADSFRPVMFLAISAVLLIAYLLRRRVSPGSRGVGLLVAPRAPVPGLSGQTLDVKAIDLALQTDGTAVLQMLGHQDGPTPSSDGDILAAIDARLDAAEAALGLPPLADQAPTHQERSS